MIGAALTFDDDSAIASVFIEEPASFSAKNVNDVSIHDTFIQFLFTFPFFLNDFTQAKQDIPQLHYVKNHTSYPIYLVDYVQYMTNCLEYPYKLKSNVLVHAKN